jgi:hypothetical protein
LFVFVLVLFLTSCDSEIDKCVKAQMNWWEELMIGKIRKKTEDRQVEAETSFSTNESHLVTWKQRRDNMQLTGVGPFADSIYRYAANQYHETYLSWKSIIWLQNILEKKKIKYMFTLADNTLFYNEFDPLNRVDPLLNAMYNEIDFSRWFVFGERQMGFNQWALLNDYPCGTTHPLDAAHEDAAKLMKNKFLEIYNKQ